MGWCACARGAFASCLPAELPVHVRLNGCLIGGLVRVAVSARSTRGERGKRRKGESALAPFLAPLPCTLG